MVCCLMTAIWLWSWWILALASASLASNSEFSADRASLACEVWGVWGCEEWGCEGVGGWVCEGVRVWGWVCEGVRSDGVWWCDSVGMGVWGCMVTVLTPSALWSLSLSEISSSQYSSAPAALAVAPLPLRSLAGSVWVWSGGVVITGAYSFSPCFSCSLWQRNPYSVCGSWFHNLYSELPDAQYPSSTQTDTYSNTNTVE